MENTTPTQTQQTYTQLRGLTTPFNLSGQVMIRLPYKRHLFHSTPSARDKESDSGLSNYQTPPTNLRLCGFAVLISSFTTNCKISFSFPH
ncbi:hypothetical protein ILYODFUR_028622 [Ilyodon furcidens]|uniref:Uncharacterized protein n=1 Tax=Ilyodon furcidens TaxID=33524 RepID=A0ABV0T107_9TELE